MITDMTRLFTCNNCSGERECYLICQRGEAPHVCPYGDNTSNWLSEREE